MNHLIVLLAAFTALPGAIFAWSEPPHQAITRAAVDALPEWQQSLLGAELDNLAVRYCMIPDNVFTDKENAKYAAMDSKPGEVYLTILHLPTQQPEYLEAMRFFMGKAVTSVREGKMSEAARHMGTICHQLEDYGSPSHTVPGDNQFQLLQQFLPASEAMKDKLLHGPIESGELNVKLTDYKPALLGTSADEAAWRLMHRVHEGIVNARSTTIPIIQALYAEDKDTVNQHQLRAATVDAQVVADMLHTVLCIGAQRFDEAQLAAVRSVPISAFFPLEAASLYFPQSQFFSSPYFGPPRVGSVLAGGKSRASLQLKVGAETQTFTEGISAGMGRSLTFLLPKGVYQQFTVLAGLHSELGLKGRVEFTISGDGRTLDSVILNGSDAARRFDCDVSSVSQLQLTLTSRGLDGKSNYAIWAAPTLIKK